MNKPYKFPQEDLEPSEPDQRPFRSILIIVMFIGGVLSFSFMGVNYPFPAGALFSITWGCIVYVFELDQPHPFPIIRRGRASVGFFCIIVGILIGAVGPNYLDTQPQTTEWLVIFGLLIGAQIGFSLILTYPLRSLSTWGGYLISAIVLHSIIFRFPSEFLDIVGAKVLVLALLCIGTWFLGQWIFFDKADPLSIEESKRVKGVKSFVGVVSGLVTLMEFINILYTIIRFGK
jgi:hypothetical protein